MTWMAGVALYGPAHKGLRWAGTRALVQLGASPGDAEAVSRALVAVRELLQLQEIHQRLEDELVLPAIEARRPGAAARLADDHAEHQTAILVLRERLSRVEAEGASPEALRRLYLELSRFVAEDLLHLYDEETFAEPLLSELYTAAELEALVERTWDRMTPAERELFEAVTRTALSLAERQQLAAPRPVRG